MAGHCRGEQPDSGRLDDSALAGDVGGAERGNGAGGIGLDDRLEETTRVVLEGQRNEQVESRATVVIVEARDELAPAGQGFGILIEEMKSGLEGRLRLSGDCVRGN